YHSKLNFTASVRLFLSLIVPCSSSRCCLHRQGSSRTEWHNVRAERGSKGLVPYGDAAAEAVLVRSPASPATVQLPTGRRELWALSLPPPHFFPFSFPRCESDFGKDENVDVKEESDPVVVSSGYPFWAAEQSGSHAFAAASPAPAERQDAPAREQPAPAPSYQAYRFHEAGDAQQLPAARDAAALGDFRARCHPLDLAAAPEHDSKQLSEGFANLPPLPPPLPPPQDYAGVVNMAIDPVGKAGPRAPVYSPYGAEQGLGQWMVPSHGQYRAMSYSAFSTDYNTQGASGHAHGTVAEWGQYPLFPYACW
uniref:TBX6L protein n=1 Tax=Dromaius novaehollandiae TaxID=8790 RepID=A0A8C4JVI5_DRONO